MSHPGSVVQPQVELSNSVLLAANLITRVLRASSEDNVQPQAALAMEALGQRLLISKEVIEMGRELFKPSKEKRKIVVDTMKLAIGLTNIGWPDAMRESISLVKAFLLAMACKVCFTDEEVGRILHGMMWSGRVTNIFPIYASQVGDFISAISGYGHAILPFSHFNKVSSAVQKILKTSDQMIVLYERSPAGTLADVLTRVFDALRNEEISRVTLEGARTGLWLVATLSWLLPEETECIIFNKRILGRPGARLSIELIDHDGWHVGEWRLEHKVESVIIPSGVSVPSIKFSHMPHMPLGSAKAEISAQFGLSPEASEATGQLAAALVDVAFKKGILVSDKCSSVVGLKEVCSENFIKIHHTIMRRYGWDHHVDSDAAISFRERQEEVAEALGAQTDRNKLHPTLHPENSSYIKMITKEIDDCNIGYYDQFNEHMLLGKDSEFLGIIDPAVHLATEALLSSFSEGGCSARIFRPCDGARVEKGAEILMGLIFRRAASSVEGYLYSKFRAEALEASLPGALPASSRDLAIASNGYVAYSKVLEGISTWKRRISVICTLPGSLKRAGGDVRDGGGFQRLVEVIADDSAYAREFHVKTSFVEPFLPGLKYVGIEPRADPNGVEAKHLLNIERAELRLTTLLQASPRSHTAPPQQILVIVGGFPKDPLPSPASWGDSIEAIAFAEHVSENMLNTDSERTLAEEWLKGGIFGKIVWHEVGKLSSQFNHSIVMTSSDEVLRFFEAGYLGRQRKLLMRQSGVPLISCLARALDPKSDDLWAIIA